MSAFALPQTTTIPMGCPTCHQDLRYDVAEQKYVCVCGYARSSLAVDPRELIVVAAKDHAATSDDLVPIAALAQQWGLHNTTVLLRLRSARVPFFDQNGNPHRVGERTKIYVRRSDAERARAQKSAPKAAASPSTALVPRGSQDVAAPHVTAVAPAAAPSVRPARVAKVGVVAPSASGRPGRLRLALEHVARLTEVSDEEANVGAIDALVRYALAVDEQDGGAS